MRKGGEKNLQHLLPAHASNKQLREQSDDRYLGFCGRTDKFDKFGSNTIIASPGVA